MAEKVLTYDRSIVAQDTYYNCGPASAQIVLSARGLYRTEADLGRRMGTHTGGTDHIGLVQRVLAAEVPAAKYATVQMPNDPPTAAQKNALWDHLVRSINAGHGLVMNIVAPPSNYPRAVAPSTQNLRYSGGTVYHYVALMGYSDEGGRRRVWWADPGFAPFGCWVSFDQTATLCPPKGYTWASAAASAPAPAPTPAPVTGTAIGPYKGAPAYRGGIGSTATPPTRQVIVVHDTEGGYEGAIGWMQSQQNASYHIIRALAGQGARLVPDTRQAWAAMRSGNRIGLHISIEGYARWTRAEWLSKGAAGLEGMAHDIAAWSKQYSIPLTRLTSADVRAGRKGVCTHNDISRAFGESDHTDPGSGFPLDLVIARARELLNPTTGGFLMALSDAEQKELLRKTREIHDQLGPKNPAWGEQSSFGKNDKGVEYTQRDGIIAWFRKLEQQIAALKK